MTNYIKEKILYLIDNEDTKQTNWKPTDTYFKFRQLQIDQRGRIGEHLIKNIFKDFGSQVEYDDDKPGDYDIIINNYRMEIKTASLDVNNKFQHEGIKDSDKWDAIIFVDVAPNNLYITIVDKSEFKFGLTNSKEPEVKYGVVFINGIEHKMHYRSKNGSNATGRGYKLDFKLKNLKETKTIDDIKQLINKYLEKK